MTGDEYVDLDDVLPSLADALRDLDVVIAQARSGGHGRVADSLERKRGDTLATARRDAAELRRLVGPDTAPDDPTAADNILSGDMGEVARVLREHNAGRTPKTKGRIRRV